MSGEDFAALAVSVIGAALFAFAAWTLTRPEPTVVDRVKGYVEGPERKSGDQTKSLIERALGDQQSSQLRQTPWMVRFERELEVASIQIAPRQLALLTLLLTIIVGWTVALTTGSAFAAVLGLFVPILVYFVISVLAGSQRRKFGEQVPDNLQVVAAALRAGQTFAGGLRAVMEDAPEPSKKELRRIVTDESIGVPIQVAIERVADRMENEEMRNLALIAMLQRETGGSSADVIDLIADTAREKTEVRRLVRSLTAQGRLSGMILTLLPVGMLLFVSYLNPGYVKPLFHTTTGLVALAVAFVLLGFGSLLIRKIVDIKV